MHLLQYNDNGEASLAEEDFDDDDIPGYTILSHTWVKGQEVTFKDMIGGTGKSKTGHDKIRFCGEQAKRDGI
jgi:hypothetical protein